MEGLAGQTDSSVVDSVAKQAMPSLELYGSEHLLPVKGESIPLEPPLAGDWVMALLLLSLILLAIARYLFSDRIGQFFRAAFASHYFNQMEREGGFFNETITYILFFNFLLSFSLLLWVTLYFFDWIPAMGFLTPLLVFFMILLMVSVFFLLKSMLLGFISWVFKTRQATQAYLKNVFLFNQLMGLFLLPVVIYTIYHPTKAAIMLAWSIWVLANLIKVVRGAYLGHNISGLSGYYLILYLCTVEIAPLLVVLKVADLYLIPG
jgi:hypothetical protein